MRRDPEAILDRIVAIVRGNLPEDISAEDLDGFLSRQRAGLVAILDAKLNPPLADEDVTPDPPEEGGEEPDEPKDVTPDADEFALFDKQERGRIARELRARQLRLRERRNAIRNPKGAVELDPADGWTEKDLTMAMKRLSQERIWVWTDLDLAIELLTERGWKPNGDPRQAIIDAVSRIRAGWASYRKEPRPAIRFNSPQPTSMSGPGRPE